jgi:hypothetical protein
MKNDKSRKIEEILFFLKNKILYCKANALKPYYFQQQLEVETNKWFKQRSEEYKQQEQ